MRKAIIGGTGLSELRSEGKMEDRTIHTKYGDVLVEMLTEDEGEIVFLARHGRDHSIPSHLVNYRANIAALAALEVDEIYATCAVGSMNAQYAIGDVVVLDDYLDFTHGRNSTFFEGEDGTIRHVLMEKPFCQRMVNHFLSVAFSFGITVRGRVLYVCTEGPRYETAAEVKMFRQFGGDVLGMSIVPECVLAREMGMCYAAVGIVTNWCTGFGDGRTFNDIVHVAERNKEKITDAFYQLLLRGEMDQGSCSCKDSLIVM